MIINKEPLLKIEWVSMAFCFAGVVAISISKQESTTPDDSLDTTDGDSAPSDPTKSSRLLGILVIFSAAWLFAGANVLNRKLKDIHFAVIVFWVGLSGLIVTFVIIVLEKVITGNPFRVYTLDQYIKLIICSFGDFGCVLSSTIAFTNDTSGFVSLVGYTSIIYGFLSDTMIFHMTLSPMALAGAIMILVVTLFTSVVKIREMNR